MISERHLSREQLQPLLENRQLETLTVEQLNELVRQEESLQQYIPRGHYAIDPRDGARIIFNTARARRPHDYEEARSEEDAAGAEVQPCPICRGQTTGVIDVADLSRGFTFINKNLYPVLYPQALSEAALASGVHLLQWTSSYHDTDWQNMPAGDRLVVLQRLAVLEEKLLFDTQQAMPVARAWPNASGTRGYVAIIKNYGGAVGGSLPHGHQQIVHSSLMPRTCARNLAFAEREGETFSAAMQRRNPTLLEIRDYGPAVLLVPYFMKRPYNMLLLLKNSGRQYLHELDEDELRAVADGWHDAIRAILAVMPRLGKERAYNIITHNGPGAGLYFEFLPYTQETGGLEHLGLWVCQEEPQSAAAAIKDLLGQPPEED